jgi:hypothetical protein
MSTALVLAVMVLIFNIRALLSLVGKTAKAALVGWLLHSLPDDFLTTFFVDRTLTLATIHSATKPTARRHALEQPPFTEQYHLAQERWRRGEAEEEELLEWAKIHLYAQLSGCSTETYVRGGTKGDDYLFYLKEVCAPCCIVFHLLL